VSVLKNIRELASQLSIPQNLLQRKGIQPRAGANGLGFFSKKKYRK
jgi:hypothetical protein